MSELKPQEIAMLDDADTLGYPRPESDHESRLVAGLTAYGYLDKAGGLTEKGKAALRRARS